MSDLDAEQRAEIRRYALQHHPDRGGDPDAFASGLAAMRQRHAAERRAADPTAIQFSRTPRGLARVPAWWRRAWARHNRPPRVQ